MRSLDRRLIRSSRVARVHLGIAVALGFTAALCVLAQAILLGRVISRVFLDGAGLGDVRGELIALVAVALTRALVSWGFEASGHMGAARVMSELRARLVDRVVSSPPAGIDGTASGELAAAAVQGVDGLDTYFSRYLPQLALAALVPLAVLAWVVHVDVIAAAIMAGTLPLIPIFMILIGRRAERRTVARWRALSRLSGHFLDVVRGLPTLRAFNRAEAQVSVLGEVGDRYRRETMKALRIAFLSALVLELLAMLGTAMVAVVLGVRLVDGGVGFQDALTVLILAPEFYLPLRQLGAQFHSAADGLAGAERVFELLDAPDALHASVQPVSVPDVRPSMIRFESVSFAYPAREGAGLEQVDLELAPGECVALVGTSGAGKSTVATLLLRFADPDGGRITVGEEDLARLDLAEWRAQIAWVPQRPHIFSGTVRENIVLGDPTASDARLREAIASAGATFVERLPQGLGTLVGEGGAQLSAGEARRLALARAFLRDAPLLVLDEPTAHLDAFNAALVADSIDRLRHGRTTLLVAHDSELARRADRIVEIDAGRIVERPSARSAA